ncbi:MAG: SDR family oxidoreductase [Tepidiformaceae bacterium]
MSAALRSGRVVIIGGSSGIGFAVAEAARDEGATVVVASSNAAKVVAAIQRLGGDASGSAVDVTDEDSVAGFFERLGAFDHLVFTAGDWDARPAVGGPSAEWDLGAAEAVFAVRFWGALSTIKHGSRCLSTAGSITLTDGVVAHRPRKGGAVSTAMGGAIEHLVRGLAVELAPIRVNAVCPGAILTEVWQSIPEERIRKMTSTQPLPRVGEPAEVAEAYLYLMRATYTTGQVLIVDGGRTLT